jgi:Ca2+-binding RTX toxin-like protein
VRNPIIVHTVSSRHPTHRPLLALLLAVVSFGATLVAAGGAQAAELPSFQCRASALAASVANQPYVEPLVANGLRGSVPGPTFDKALCSSDEQGAGDLTNSVGLQSLIGTSAVQVRTSLTPETGSSAAQTATASTTIADLDLRLLGTNPSFLRIGAVKATATARCVNGKAEFTGSSEITDINLLGQSVSLDGLVNGLAQALSDLGLDPVVKIYPLNQVTKTGDSVVVTPLRIQVLSGGNTQGGVLDLTVGETKVAQRGDACNPPAVNPDDPNTGGDGICPVGSIPVGQGPRVCQIPATDRYGLVVIGVPNSTDAPRGGRVLPLTEARRLAAAGLLPNSKCLTGPGLDYVVLGDENKNRIYGTKNRDRIMGLGKTDALSSLDAADCLDGGSGNDRLYGGTANDRVYGGTGKDHAYGENGNDRIYGGSSRDYLYGDKGNDVLEGESGSDLLVGGQENDTLRGADGNDQLYGQDGRDKIDGGVGDDRLSGGYNTNTLVGGAGRSLVVNGKPSGSGRTTIDLRAATKPSVVKCGSRRDVVLVNRAYASRNRYSSNCTTIRVSR